MINNVIIDEPKQNVTSLALRRATNAVSCRISLRAPFISRFDLCCSFLSSFCALLPFFFDMLAFEKGSKLKQSDGKAWEKHSNLGENETKYVFFWAPFSLNQVNQYTRDRL